MSGLIGDRKEKSVLEEMAEVARERNAEVAEEERLENIRKAKKEAERKAKAGKENKIPVKDEESVTTPASGIAGITADYICLENITCVDAEGKVFEKQDKIYVPKSIEKKDGSPIRKTPYNWIVYFENKGMALPSFALSCNILEVLWQNRNNPDCMHVLMQYKDKGDGYGWHVQNTIVDYAEKKIIHYPFDSDFPNNRSVAGINSGRKRVLLHFKNKSTLKIESLEQALQHRAATWFVRQFTGLKNPAVLIEIGKYFGKEAKVWCSDYAIKYKEIRAAWLGYNSNGFNLYAYEHLKAETTARGVRSSQEAGGSQ